MSEALAALIGSVADSLDPSLLETEAASDSDDYDATDEYVGRRRLFRRPSRGARAREAEGRCAMKAHATKDTSWIDASRDELGYEEVVSRALANTALLQRYAEAESETDRGGSHTAVEQHAWRAVRHLMWRTREDIQWLNDEIEKKRGAK